MITITTKQEYDELIEHIQIVLDTYQNSVVSNNAYLFYLANGESLYFTIAPDNLAHLLGINLDYLRSTSLFHKKNSYELLNEFLDEAYFVYCQVQAGHLSFPNIFSPYIEEKLNAFQTITNYLQPNEIEFVCKYDRTRTFINGTDHNYPFQYIIAKKGMQDDLFMLGLIQKGDSDNYYSPISGMYFSNQADQKEQLNQVLRNQVLTYPTGIKTINKSHSFNKVNHLTVDEKLSQITNLMEYKNYIENISIDTSNELQFSINNILSKKSIISAYRSFLMSMISTINNRQLVNIDSNDDFYKDMVIKGFIESYNNMQCQGVINENGQESYSNLMAQYQQSQIALKALDQQYQDIKVQCEQYQNNYNDILVRNKVLENFQNQIFEIVDGQKIKK